MFWAPDVLLSALYLFIFYRYLRGSHRTKLKIVELLPRLTMAVIFAGIMICKLFRGYLIIPIGVYYCTRRRIGHKPHNLGHCFIDIIVNELVPILQCHLILTVLAALVDLFIYLSPVVFIVHGLHYVFGSCFWILFYPPFRLLLDFLLSRLG